MGEENVMGIFPDIANPRLLLMWLSGPAALHAEQLSAPSLLSEVKTLLARFLPVSHPLWGVFSLQERPLTHPTTLLCMGPWRQAGGRLPRCCRVPQERLQQQRLVGVGGWHGLLR